MIVTPLKLIRLPTRAAPSSLVLHIESIEKAEALASWLQGGQPCPSLINFILATTRLSDLAQLKTPELPLRGERLKVICKDGEIDYHKERLRSRYQLIDDYLSDFPNETTIKVPFTVEEMTGMTGLNSTLVESYLCIDYFNPKSVLSYFEYDTTGTPPSIIESLAERLTSADRKDILEARRLGGKQHPLPDEGLGKGILACILEYHMDDQSLLYFFSDYPSYLTFALTDNAKASELLLTADYHRGEYCGNSIALGGQLDFLVVSALASRTMASATRESGQAYCKRLLAMMGVRHKMFENADLDFPLPYHLSSDHFLRRLAKSGALEVMIQATKNVMPTFDREEDMKAAIQEITARLQPEENEE